MEREVILKRCVRVCGCGSLLVFVMGIKLRRYRFFCIVFDGGGRMKFIV